MKDDSSDGGGGIEIGKKDEMNEGKREEREKEK